MNREKLQSKIPKYVFKIAEKLEKRGFQAYLAGGSMRDILMNRIPKDYDINTDALPNDIVDIFPKAVTTGAKFGSIIVLTEDEDGETIPVDVTTYRLEEKYINGRWPSHVEFTTKIEKDLSRRDFTINAIAVNLIELMKGLKSDFILDPYQGREDIGKCIVRAVGNAEERLKEDSLRALRACRFSSVLSFKLDPEVKDAIKSVLDMIDNLSAERVRDEFLKILYDSPKPSIGLELLKETGILGIWIPELLEGVGVEQPEFHEYDVFKHALRTVDLADDSVKLAALFHDIAKPRKKEGSHFYGHDVLGEKMTKEIMKKLRFSNKEIDRVSRLVRWHMFYFPYDEEEFMKGRVKKRRSKKISTWSDAAVRRFVKNVGGPDAIDELMKLRIADATANPKSSFDEREIEALQGRISEVRKKDMVMKTTDLDINGNDLKKIGIKAGPRMGLILKELLELVIEEPALNDKQKLIDIVKDKYGHQ